MTVAIVRDKLYSPEEAEAISRARQQRWALLCHLAQYPLDAIAWQRKKLLDRELYKLTGHEIYNPNRKWSR